MDLFDKFVEFLSLLSLSFGAPDINANSYKYAVCYVRPNALTGSGGSNNITGRVLFRQELGEHLELKLNISGLLEDNPDQLFGFHIHKYGDTSSCQAMGGHFNPFDKTHGAPNSTTRHVGDLGNIEVDSNGRVVTSFTDKFASLYGTNSIAGRGIVIHAGRDDLGMGGDEGSSKTGNAGPRLACCTIAITDVSVW